MQHVRSIDTTKSVKHQRILELTALPKGQFDEYMSQPDRETVCCTPLEAREISSSAVQAACAAADVRCLAGSSLRGPSQPGAV